MLFFHGYLPPIFTFLFMSLGCRVSSNFHFCRLLLKMDYERCAVLLKTLILVISTFGGKSIMQRGNLRFCEN
jgi:hypothetical protein